MSSHTFERLTIVANRKIRVLRQLCTWQLVNAERFRERADVRDLEQLSWVKSRSSN